MTKSFVLSTLIEIVIIASNTYWVFAEHSVVNAIAAIGLTFLLARQLTRL